MTEKAGSQHASIEVDDSRVRAMFRRIPGAVRQGALDAVRDVLWMFHGRVAKRQFGAYPGPGRESPHPPNKLYARSGLLRASLEVVGPRFVGLDVRGAATISGRQAKLQEFGGTVRPKRARMLTIPMPATLTPSGVVRAKFRLVKSGVWQTAGGEPTFIFRSGSAAFVAIASGRKQKGIKLLYMLRPSVQIKGRLGFFSTWRALEKQRLAVMEEMLARSLRAAKPLGGGGA